MRAGVRVRVFTSMLSFTVGAPHVCACLQEGGACLCECDVCVCTLVRLQYRRRVRPSVLLDWITVDILQNRFGNLSSVLVEVSIVRENVGVASEVHVGSVAQEIGNPRGVDVCRCVCVCVGVCL